VLITATPWMGFPEQLFTVMAGLGPATHDFQC
jgi:hypothetical protein